MGRRVVLFSTGRDAILRAASPMRRPRSTEPHDRQPMTETKDAPRKREEIRVVDRRGFTPEGERRMPDLPGDDAVPPLPPQSRAAEDRAKDRRPGPGPQAPASREDQVASAYFKNLILNLAATAAANLGEIANPASGRTEVNLDGARQVIDLLQALHLKTKGNLTAEETRLLDDVLYDLQAEFVSRQKQASKTS